MPLALVPHDTYLIRWPSWVGVLIAFGVLCGFFCAAATALRRLWGALGLGAILVAAAGLMISLAWSEYPGVSFGVERGLYWGVFLFCTVVAFIIPAGVIHRVERRQPRPGFGRTIGYGLASGYLAMLAGGIAFTLIVLIIRLLRVAAP